MVHFAEWALRKGSSYSRLSTVSIALSMLTGSRLTFFIDGQFVCSGLVARARERTGSIFDRDSAHIAPADLAKYFHDGGAWVGVRPGKGRPTARPARARPGADPELAVGVRQVVLDRLRRQEQLGGGLGVGRPAGDDQCHLQLLRGELQGRGSAARRGGAARRRTGRSRGRRGLRVPPAARARARGPQLGVGALHPGGRAEADEAPPRRGQRLAGRAEPAAPPQVLTQAEPRARLLERPAAPRRAGAAPPRRPARRPRRRPAAGPSSAGRWRRRAGGPGAAASRSSTVSARRARSGVPARTCASTRSPAQSRSTGLPRPCVSANSAVTARCAAATSGRPAPSSRSPSACSARASTIRNPVVGAEPQGPAGVLPAGGFHAEAGLDRRQDRQRLWLLGGPAGLLCELDGGVGVGQRGGPVAVAPAGRGQPGQQERQQADRTRRAGAAHARPRATAAPPPAPRSTRRCSPRRRQLVDRQRVRRREQGLARGEQRAGPGGVVGERQGQGVDQHHRQPLRRPAAPARPRPPGPPRRGRAAGHRSSGSAAPPGCASPPTGAGSAARVRSARCSSSSRASVGWPLHICTRHCRWQAGMISAGSSVSTRARSSSGVAAATLPAVCAVSAASSSRRMRAGPRRAQPGRALEQRQRGDVVVAGGRVAGCGGELRGHVLVRARGRRGEVEGPALGGAGARRAGRARPRAPGAPRASGRARRRGRPRCGSAGGGSAGRCRATGRRGRRGPGGRRPRPARGRRRRGPARPAPRRRRRPRCRRRRPAAGPGGWRRAARRGAARRRARAGC